MTQALLVPVWRGCEPIFRGTDVSQDVICLQEFSSYIQNILGWHNVPNISVTRSCIPVSRPPVQEQTAIGNVLSIYDSLI